MTAPTPSDQTAQAAPTGALEASLLPPIPPTLAERLRALEAQCAATSERYTTNGQVFVALTMASGDRLAGSGATTAAAITHLEQRVASLYPLEG